MPGPPRARSRHSRFFGNAPSTALAAEGKAQIDRLRVDGRPIAATVTLSSGDTAWCWKIAYDESYARFSPGAQLLHDLTQRLLDDPHIARADSCATADHSLIDHVWRERLPLCDRLIHVGPAMDDQPLRSCGCWSGLRRGAVALLRRVRGPTTAAESLRPPARKRILASPGCQAAKEN